MEVEFTDAKPLAPIVVVGTPDVSLAGIRILLAASKPHSRYEWPVRFRKSKVDEKLSDKTSVETPLVQSVVKENEDDNHGTSPAKIVQLNFGDKKDPALTFLAVNTLVPHKESISLANSFLTTILGNDKKVKSLILLNPLRVDPTLPYKTRIPEGIVQYGVWNKHQAPKSIKTVDTRIRNVDPFLCALAHFSFVLEIPTLSLNTRGYRYQPGAAASSSSSSSQNPKYDGTEDVALSLWKALKEILSKSLQSIKKEGGGAEEEEIIDAAAPDIKKFRSLKINKKSIASSQPILGTSYSNVVDGGEVVDNRNVLYT